jgi:hypothetical protein
MLENSSTTSLIEASTPVGADSADSAEVRGGKIKLDPRGNAVWDWGVATGVFARMKSTDLLNMLDNPTLALEASVGDWAGDPYNRR